CRDPVGQVHTHARAGTQGQRLHRVGDVDVDVHAALQRGVELEVAAVVIDEPGVVDRVLGVGLLEGRDQVGRTRLRRDAAPDVQGGGRRGRAPAAAGECGEGGGAEASGEEAAAAEAGRGR